jgi:hypothetical protein
LPGWLCSYAVFPFYETNKANDLLSSGISAKKFEIIALTQTLILRKWRDIQNGR